MKLKYDFYYDFIYISIMAVFVLFVLIILVFNKQDAINRAADNTCISGDTIGCRKVFDDSINDRQNKFLVEYKQSTGKNLF